jgi:hypothetical protein
MVKKRCEIIADGAARTMFKTIHEDSTLAVVGIGIGPTTE